MNYINFSNINLKINDEIIYSPQASLSTELSVSAVFTEGGKVPDYFSPQSPIGGSLSFTYFLTGKDQIYDHVYKADSPVSINLGGLVINSGYLTSYSFEAVPYTNVKINATLKFFEKVKGQVQKNNEITKPQKLTTIRDITINDKVNISENDLLSTSYGYSTDFYPSFEITDGLMGPSLKRVVAGNKTVKSSFSTYDYDIEIDPSLPKHEARIKFEDQEYILSGPIVTDVAEISADNILVRNYGITQGVLEFEPTITDFNPKKGYGGQKFTVEGANLNNVVAAFIEDNLCSVTPIDESSFEMTVPEDLFVGFKGSIEVSTLGGRARSTDLFEVG